MYLKTLQLENFRNYKNLKLTFNENQVTVLIGKNAQGKTNLLESIYSLALTKSFRSKKNFDQICWNREHSRIKGQINNKNGEQNLEIFCSKAPSCQKVLKLNESKVKSLDFIGNLNIVIFTPDDINLISLSPSIRRKYLNMIISQVDKIYLQDLIEYSKIIKQRNALLPLIKEKRAKEDEIFYWDEMLVAYGSRIIKKRQSIIKYFNENLTNFYKQISNTKDNLKIRYTANITPEKFEEKLKSRLKKDIIFCKTSIGPHRDDISFYLNNKDIQEFGSRGEYRSTILSLKFAEISYIKHKTDDYPLLLLDDVFSELDKIRQEQFFASIENCQTIITTTHKPENFKKYLEKAVIHNVEEGEVK